MRAALLALLLAGCVARPCVCECRAPAPEMVTIPPTTGDSSRWLSPPGPDFEFFDGCNWHRCKRGVCTMTLRHCEEVNP